MGKNLHIHPITIIFVLLTAGKLFGVVGIILAIPGYAVIKVVTTHLFDWFKMRSHLYEEEKMMLYRSHKIGTDMIFIIRQAFLQRRASLCK